MKKLLVLVLLPGAIWAQEGRELVLPDLRVEVDPGEVPGWETLAPGLPALSLPSLEPRLPPLPNFDPSQPQWSTPPAVALPREEEYRQPPFFDENGVRGLLLTGLGAPLLSVLQVQVEQRQPQLHTLVGFDFRGRQLDSVGATTRGNINLRLGGERDLMWTFGFDAHQTTLPLWGATDQPLDRLENRGVRTLATVGLLEPWLGLQLDMSYQERLRYSVSEPARLFATVLGLWLRVQPNPEWRLDVEVTGGGQGVNEWDGSLEASPTLKARTRIDYLNPIVGLQLFGHLVYRTGWEGSGKLQLGIYPLPWEFRLYGQYLQEQSAAVPDELRPNWTVPLDRTVEAGGEVQWSNQVDGDLWMQAGWRLFYQWGLSVHRWTKGPLGLAQSQELVQNRQQSDLQLGFRTSAVDVGLRWSFNFLASETGEEAHHLGLRAQFSLGPASWGGELDWGTAFIDPARLDLFMRFQTTPNWQLEAILEDVLLSTAPNMYRTEVGNFRSPGFGGYLGLRYSW